MRYLLQLFSYSISLCPQLQRAVPSGPTSAYPLSGGPVLSHSYITCDISQIATLPPPSSSKKIQLGHTGNSLSRHNVFVKIAVGTFPLFKERKYECTDTTNKEVFPLFCLASSCIPVGFRELAPAGHPCQCGPSCRKQWPWTNPFLWGGVHGAMWGKIQRKPTSRRRPGWKPANLRPMGITTSC